MTRRWVFDASPLILLAKIGQQDLIAKLCTTPVIPDAVAAEINRGPASDPARAWLQTDAHDWIEASVLLPLVAAWGLGRGESAAISYAYQHPGAVVILDERTARTCAQSLRLKVRGTLGIRLLAKREGHLTKIRPHLDDLVKAGFRVDDALLKAILELADER